MFVLVKYNQALPENGRRLVLRQGTEPSDYIEISVKRNLGKEGELMSDYEMLSIVLMILGIVVTILIAYINHTKK